MSGCARSSRKRSGTFLAAGPRSFPKTRCVGLEDVEQTVASDAATTDQSAPAERAARAANRRINRGSLPTHLPRLEFVVDIDDKVCLCCKGDLHRIGEDKTERLDIVPAQFRVLVTRRSKYACRRCEDGVVQALAPARLIEGGMPTEATIAQVLVSKYADHLPLYRQAQIYARQGIDLYRSALADWGGSRCLASASAAGAAVAKAKGATPVVCGRDNRSGAGSWPGVHQDRPALGLPLTIGHGVAVIHRASFTSTHPIDLEAFKGILQVDGYAGYRKLADRGDVRLAFC